ncbi:IclR family transcriptional regulator [Mameliella alba]|nr:IclR family transcriptional regulator [Mameliella sediminis]MBY6116681.1 IclR family transcriptional regulator [Antarctobacter heliothermus]MBY6146434.1 IclR family transcriptional regulator [Mameliella alba]MBY6163064.1 IclR family transcriptional regulator [Mameliella alba]MBY6171328.1 IclR family transcriptional regulator [Mameliella alba]
MGTITKALELLNYFSRTKREIGLVEFARLSQRDKATVHRHLVELEANGFVEQHPQTRAYRLGPAILRLTAVREATHPIRRILRPIVDGLAQEVGELCHTSLLQGDMLSPVYHADPMIHGTQVHFDEGEMLPLHATSSGLAVLAFSPPELADQVLSRPLKAYTDQTLTDPAFLRSILEDVRRCGLCSLDQAFDSEVCSVGGPLFGADGLPAGAISVAVPAVRAQRDKMDQIRGALRSAIHKATISTGGMLPRQGAALWTDTPVPTPPAQ